MIAIPVAMKTTAFLFVAMFITMVSYSQEKPFKITDRQYKGVNYYDTITSGHPYKEVFVEKGLTNRKNKHAKLDCDTCDIYRVRFINEFEDRRVDYSITHIGQEGFSEGTYKWVNDTTVSVTLINPENDYSKTYVIKMFEDRTLLMLPDMK